MLKRELGDGEPKAHAETGGMPEVGRREGGLPRRRPQKAGQVGRGLAILKGLVLVALVVVALYGMLDRGLYDFERWLPVASAVLGVLFTVWFMGTGYFKDTPRPVWALVALLAALVAVKGLSLTWSIDPTETVKELTRSSMYLAVFALAAASLSSRWLVGPLVDGMILTTGAVAGYGVLQKTNPVEHPPNLVDGVRVDSTLGYANTTAVVLGMGVALSLSRMTALRNPIARGSYAALILASGAALYFAFSRGGMLSLGVGLLALFVASERRTQMLASLILVGGPLAWLLTRARNLGSLSSYTPDEIVRAIDGAAFRTDLIVAVLGAFVLQAGFAVLVGRYGLTPKARLTLGVTVASAFLMGAVIMVYPVVDRHLESGGSFSIPVKKIKKTEDISERLTSAGPNDGRRIEYWKVAWEEWKEHPLTGTGAGTFKYTWLENRPDPSSFVKQVHNVYLEQGTETGIFAFLALLGFAAFLVFYAAREAWRATGERRMLLSGLVATVVVYLVSSGLEWHWHIPSSTIFFFLLAGATAKFASKPEW